MKAVMFPGQGSQFKGMGQDLFRIYRNETLRASEVLGYDVEALCISDPDGLLNLTQYTQPAIYTVNAFAFFEQKQTNIEYYVGHSLGEYNALLAAGAFDFETGLRLVKKRGELMAAASGGSMAAVLGIDAETIAAKLRKWQFDEIDVANYNTPTQTVLSGPKNQLDRLLPMLEQENIRAVPLNVSAPFHSRYMKPAAHEFKQFLTGFTFQKLKKTIIANVTAQPYDENIPDLLAKQIASPVQWVKSIRLLMGFGVTEFKETGGAVLSKMVNEIRENCTPLPPLPVMQPAAPKAKLFMLHFAGGSRYSYQFMIPHLDCFDLVPVELPGRGRRSAETLLNSFAAALEDVYEQIRRKITPHRDVIYGHSLGAILGFWVTDLLEKTGLSPKQLFVTGNSNPGVKKNEFLQQIHQLPEEEFLSAMRIMGGMPNELFQNQDMFRFYEPILRADFKLVDSVSGIFPNPISTPISVVMGTAEPGAACIGDWQHYTRGTFESMTLPGGHFFIHRHGEILARMISQRG